MESSCERRSSGSGIGHAASPARVGGVARRVSRKASSLAMIAGDACAERDHLRAGEGGDVDDRVGLAPRWPGTGRRRAPCGPRRRCRGSRRSCRCAWSRRRWGAARCRSACSRRGRGSRSRRRAARARRRRARSPPRLRRRPCRTSSSACRPAGLMHRPPESNVMPLPTSASEALALAGAQVSVDDPRRVDRTLPDADDAAEAALGERLLVEHLHRDLGRGGGRALLDRRRRTTAGRAGSAGC